MADRPNVLVIMTDQHRADLMTCAGRDLVPTPNIDRIAQRGVRFTNAYCPYPVCVASRMSLLTGLYAHTTGAVNNTDRLDWRYRTIAHHFAGEGYLAGLIGKMHFGDGHKHGFEYYLSINDWLMTLGPKVQDYANEIANHPLGPQFFETVDDDGAGLPDVSGIWGSPGPWVGNVDRWDFEDMETMASPLAADDHLDAFIARETEKFLAERGNQPFLLFASLMKPHSPFYAPKEWAERHPISEMELPQIGDISGYPEHIQRRIEQHERMDPRRRRAHRAGYLANLAFADHCVGELYGALEREGLLENTIVVYTSDHGEMDGDHGLNQKFCLFEPAAKVPLIVSWPGTLPQGEACEGLTEYIGLYPTLCDLAGLPAPEGLDVEGFAELVREPDSEGPETAFSEFNLRTDNCQYMIRTRRYKYIHNTGGTDELYDLEVDPGELKNLIHEATLQGVAEGLKARLFEWFDPAANRFGGG